MSRLAFFWSRNMLPSLASRQGFELFNLYLKQAVGFRGVHIFTYYIFTLWTLL